MSKINILIVGSKGYLGSQLYQYFEKKNFSVYGIDSCLYSKTSFNSNYQKNFQLIDCRDFNTKLLKKFTHVIFLAGLSNNPIDNLFPNKAYKIVENYTIDFAKKCKNLNIKFIFPSSCSVYGYGNQNKIFKEDTKTNPLTYYSKNKISIEKRLQKISNKNFKPIILRLATVFGVSNSIRLDVVINMFIAQVISTNKIILNSDGSAFRPHVNIRYVCDVIFFFINFNPKKISIYNVGSDGFNYRIIQVCKVIKKFRKSINVINLKSNKSLFHENLFKTKDPRSYKVSFSKIKKLKIKSKYNKNFYKEIKELYFELKNIMFDKKNFINNINFYRLQKIKKNLSTKKSTYDLRSKFKT